jgi:hypothetical protein
MMMKMLEAGGVPVMTDHKRVSDDHNPEGYYELERVLTLDKEGDRSWLKEARGKAVKIISELLAHLPDGNNYKVIFMQRDLREVMASQNRMLVDRGAASETVTDEEMRAMFETHLRKTAALLARRPCFERLDVSYRSVVEEPRAAAAAVNDFLGGGLDIGRMAEVANPRLYRNRAG